MYKPKFYTKYQLMTELDKTISRYVDDIEKLVEIRKEIKQSDIAEYAQVTKHIEMAGRVLERLYEQREGK